MAPRLSNRVAIITGSSSGLGRAIALAYARESALVMCADLKPNVVGKYAEDYPVPTHESIVKNGGRASFVTVDVRMEEQVKEMIVATVKEFGRLDIMVNNAGIAPDVDGLAAQPGGRRVHETETSIFDQVISINTRGVFLGCKYAISQFLAQEPLPVNARGDRTRGWIVNTVSTAGLVALIGAPSYITSKHAVVGLTKQIAVDYAGDRIHCNALCPSFVDTPLIAAITRDKASPLAVGTTSALTEAHPWGTLGQVEDVAGGAVFLVSEDAQWITGHPLVIDGGYIAK